MAGWFTMENPTLKWRMTRGTPISGNHQIGIIGIKIWNYDTSDLKWMSSLDIIGISGMLGIVSTKKWI